MQEHDRSDGSQRANTYNNTSYNPQANWNPFEAGGNQIQRRSESQHNSQQLNNTVSGYPYQAENFGQGRGHFNPNTSFQPAVPSFLPQYPRQVSLPYPGLGQIINPNMTLPAALYPPMFLAQQQPMIPPMINMQGQPMMIPIMYPTVGINPIPQPQVMGPPPVSMYNNLGHPLNQVMHPAQVQQQNSYTIPQIMNTSIAQPPMQEQLSMQNEQFSHHQIQNFLRSPSPEMELEHQRSHIDDPEFGIRYGRKEDSDKICTEMEEMTLKLLWTIDQNKLKSTCGTITDFDGVHTLNLLKVLYFSFVCVKASHPDWFYNDDPSHRFQYVVDEELKICKDYTAKADFIFDVVEQLEENLGRLPDPSFSSYDGVDSCKVSEALNIAINFIVERKIDLQSYSEGLNTDRPASYSNPQQMVSDYESPAVFQPESSSVALSHQCDLRPQSSLSGKSQESDPSSKSHNESTSDKDKRATVMEMTSLGLSIYNKIISNKEHSTTTTTNSDFDNVDSSELIKLLEFFLARLNSSNEFGELLKDWEKKLKKGKVWNPYVFDFVPNCAHIVDEPTNVQNVTSVQTTSTSPTNNRERSITYKADVDSGQDLPSSMKSTLPPNVAVDTEPSFGEKNKKNEPSLTDNSYMVFQVTKSALLENSSSSKKLSEDDPLVKVTEDDITEETIPLSSVAKIVPKRAEQKSNETQCKECNPSKGSADQTIQKSQETKPGSEKRSTPTYSQVLSKRTGSHKSTVSNEVAPMKFIKPTFSPSESPVASCKTQKNSKSSTSKTEKLPDCQERFPIQTRPNASSNLEWKTVPLSKQHNEASTIFPTPKRPGVAKQARKTTSLTPRALFNTESPAPNTTSTSKVISGSYKIASNTRKLDILSPRKTPAESDPVVTPILSSTKRAKESVSKPTQKSHDRSMSSNKVTPKSSKSEKKNKKRGKDVETSGKPCREDDDDEFSFRETNLEISMAKYVQRAWTVRFAALSFQKKRPALHRFYEEITNYWKARSLFSLPIDKLLVRNTLSGRLSNHGNCDSSRISQLLSSLYDHLCEQVVMDVSYVYHQDAKEGYLNMLENKLFDMIVTIDNWLPEDLEITAVELDDLPKSFDISLSNLEHFTAYINRQSKLRERFTPPAKCANGQSSVERLIQLHHSMKKMDSTEWNHQCTQDYFNTTMSIIKNSNLANEDKEIQLNFYRFLKEVKSCIIDVDAAYCAMVNRQISVSEQLAMWFGNNVSIC